MCFANLFYMYLSDNVKNDVLIFFKRYNVKSLAATLPRRPLFFRSVLLLSQITGQEKSLQAVVFSPLVGFSQAHSLALPKWTHVTVLLWANYRNCGALLHT
jgi:hypothetical protein